MKFLNYLLVACFFILIFSISYTTSSDFNQDLGRHLKLGEIIVKILSVPKTNLFSYTNPTYPFINHHWLSEVIFYFFTSILGLNSLIILKVILIIASFAIIIKCSHRRSSILAIITTVLIFSPLLLDRLDIRPEIFGYLLFSFLLYTTLSYPQNKKLIYFMPFIMLFWVNMHISFVFGIFLILLLIIKILSTNKKPSNLSFSNFLIPLLSIGAMLINPNGIKGLIYPFTIFGNYGYTIVENQNLFYLSKMTFNPLIKYFFLLSPLVVATLIIFLIKKKYIKFILLLTFFLLPIVQIRHLPFFVLITIPTVSITIDKLIGLIRIEADLRQYFAVIIIVIALILSLSFINNDYVKTFDKDGYYGMGFKEDYKGAVEFIESNNLPKNIFNNFDIGGYLIYKLYPKYQFFVDNRPEAYPKDFLENIYKNSQMDEKLRNEIFNQYDINTVVFNHTDQTDWAKIFINSMFNERYWKLVYLDANTIIFSKKLQLTNYKGNNEYYANLIKREDNYLNLLKLAQFFRLIDKPDLVELALIKAEEINSTSCSIKRSLFYQSQNPALPYQGKEIRKNYWYCF